MKKSCALLCLILALLWSCHPSNTGTHRKTALALSGEGVGSTFKEIIAEATTGRVSVKARIAVRFVKEMPGAASGGIVSPKVLAFTPPVGGLLNWSDGFTLVFEPFKPLPVNTHFAGVLNLPDLAPGFKGRPSFRFEFFTEMNEVTDLSFDWRPASPADPGNVIMAAKLVLAQAVPVDKLKGALYFKTAGGQNVPLTLRQEGATAVYAAESAPIMRPADIARFSFGIGKDLLGADADVVQEVLLQPVQKMAVQDWRILQEENTLGVEAQFNEALKEGTDYAAYVQITPHVNLHITARGRSLLITGDFKRQTSYVCTLQAGISNVWGGKMESPVRKDVVFSDQKPAVKFAEGGTFLPSRLNRKLAFDTINLRRGHLSIFKVYASNLGQFLQTNNLEDKMEWGFNEMDRVGEEVVSEDLAFSGPRNEWSRQELEMEGLFAKEPKGLFVIGFSFAKGDIDYPCKKAGKSGGGEEEGAEEEGGGRDYNDYYSNPCSDGFYYRGNKVFKPVLISDIGLLAVQEKEKLTVFADNIQNARPLAGVKVTLYSYQNQPMGSAVTDGEGRAVFTQHGHMIVAEKEDQKSVLKFASDRLGMDAFPVEGVTSTSSSGIQAFLYSERGVYRPGDRVHLASILREGVNQIPVKVPVRLKVVNALHQEVMDALSDKAVDGLSAWTIPTQVQDPTGMWEARLFIGDEAVGAYPFRVETIAPPRIKAALKTDKPAYIGSDKTVNLSLSSDYLFGAPGAGLNYTVKAETAAYTPAFEAWKKFSFIHEGKKFKGETQPVSEDALDDAGKAAPVFTIPDMADTPGGVQLTFRAEVFEKGGRPLAVSARALYHPYPAYAGLDRSNLYYCKTHATYKVPVLLVDPDGRALEGKKLSVRFYRSEHSWWYDYGSRNEFFQKYKTDASTRLERSVDLVSRKEPQTVDFTPEEDGQYLIEVRDVDGGHEAGAFVYASFWGGEAAGKKGGAVLAIQSDRELYHPHDTARLTLGTPEAGTLTWAVVKGDVVLQTKTMALSSSTTTLNIPVTAEMAPNVYVFAEAVQPYAQTRNDRPLRAYGVLPLSVEEPESRIPLEISVPEEIRPDHDLTVALQTKDGKSGTATLAVVDEGLLILTNFQTPDPWTWFYRKLALNAPFFDIFDAFMGMAPGPVRQTFKVGGDMGEGRAKRRAPEINRFPPVSLFEGPITLDSRGAAKVTFHLPHYMGEVRVMAVACRGRAYGAAEKDVKVRDDVVVLSTLPRVMGPGESFQMPVSVFSTKDGVGKVTLTLETSDHLAVAGEKAQTLEFSGKEEKTALFSLKANNLIGPAQVTLKAKWGGGESEEKTSFMVRPIYPYVSTSAEKIIEPHGTLKLDVAAFGLEGTRSAVLALWRTKPVPIGKRLGWLMHYPYGCIEQTTSSVFPQLYLKPIIASSPAIKDKEWLQTRVDDAVNAGISRLVSFSLPDGSFSYWPGGKEKADEWSGLYAGHFLVEAKKLGYHTPYILDKWLEYEGRRAVFEDKNWRSKTYRLYILASAGRPDLSAMNLIQENYMGQLDTVDKWMLAAAYKMAGADDLANQVRRGLTYEAPAKSDSWRWCFGSTLGDLGILLNTAVAFGDEAEALRLADLINTQLKSDDWYSTQAVAWALMGQGRFIESTWKKGAALKGSVAMPDGRTVSFTSEDAVVRIPVDGAVGKSVTITSGGDAKIFAELTLEGIPLSAPYAFEQKGMSVSVEFFDEAGSPVDAKAIPKGTTFYAHFAMRTDVDLDHVALTQIFPAGWEIMNIRMTGEALPQWTEKFTKNEGISYEDIRDDRILWFMDRTNAQTDYHFFAKLVAVTKGSYTLPPTYAEAMYDHAYFAYAGHGSVEVK